MCTELCFNFRAKLGKKELILLTPNQHVNTTCTHQNSICFFHTFRTCSICLFESTVSLSIQKQ